MLILTRRISESIVIGKDAEIRVTVLNVTGNQVRLAIDAPRDIPIDREEIRMRKDDND